MPEFENPPATVDVPAARVTRIVSVDAPCSAVWRCLTEPDLLARWLGDIAAFPEGVVEGATGRFAWTGEVVLAARFLAVEPERRVAFSWAEGILSDRASVVEIDLQELHGATQVHLVESGFPLEGDDASKREALRALAAGWTVELDELVELAEGLAA
ncbi:SRPBCC domain-containing protein [Agrococcus sp. SL85]|uniref:SRPBCC domain-containing protein n=1 Tax=Agrococcus sp. SL85 TaxID=2995141 RepID=UPI00226D2421|nr:SRPBCC domain-containing protein [Agrococcus sp. SL85]WAC65699.1 SRPBCC domain-containing protein [Agrococcus sp. SL85]